MQTANGEDRRTSPVFSMEVLRASVENSYGRRVVINGVPEDELDKRKAADDRANGVKGALFVITFIAGIIAAVVFSQLEPLLCISSVGAIFLVIGVIAVAQSKLSLDNAPLLIVPTVGLLMTALPIVMLYGRDHPDGFQLTFDHVMNIILAGFVLVGVCMMVLPPLVHSGKMARCSQETDAKCIYRTFRIKKSSKANGRTSMHNIYAPVWQYEVGGVIYVTCENVYSGFDVPKIGEYKRIRFDPAAPENIYRPLGGTRVVTTVLGLMFTALGILTFVVLRHK